MDSNWQKSKSALYEILSQNDHTLRHLILYEFVQNPGSRRFDVFRKCLEPRIIEYLEFDFWFARFENGNFDLNVDSSEIPREGKIGKIPVNVIRDIIRKLDPSDVNALRSVNRGFREIAETETVHYQKFELNVEGHDPDFFEEEYTKCVLIVNDDSSESRLTFGAEPLEVFGFVEKPLKNMYSLFVHPKIHFKIFGITVQNDPGSLVNLHFAVKLKEFFFSTDRRFQAETLTLRLPEKDDVLEMLRCFEPESLKELKVGVTSIDLDEEDYDLSEIFASKYWKCAKRVQVGNFQNNLKIQDLFHLTAFDVCTVFSPQEIKELTDKIIAKPDFENGTIRTYDEFTQTIYGNIDVETVTQILGNFTAENGSRVRNIPIPETNQILEIRVYLVEISFRKTTLHL